MNDKPKSKTIEIPIFFGKLILIQTNDRGFIKEKYLKEVEVDLDMFEGLSFRNYQRSGYSMYVIWVNENITLEGLAHESLHTANYILKDRMVGVTLENDEAQAYLMGWILKQCLKYFKTK